MDQIRISDALHLPPGAPIQLTDMHVALWGRELIFDALHGDVPFRLTLTDCRDVHWRLYAHTQPAERVPFPVATIVNFSLGKDRHRQSLQILTEFFGLSISYDLVKFEKV